MAERKRRKEKGSEREKEESRSREKTTQRTSQPGSGRVGRRGVEDTGEQAEELEGQSWYHGMLPRDDAAALLQHRGDFLVRTSQVEDKAGGEITKTVLSVCWDPKSKTGVKHFVVAKTKTGEEFYIVEKMTAPSIMALVTTHKDKQIPVDKTGVVLLQAVAKADWELEHEQLVLGETLGKGAFGEVFRGTLQLQSPPRVLEVAVKSYKAGGKGGKEERMKFMKEARIMRGYQHKNIVRLYGVAASREPLFIVMELCPGGSLLAHLKKTWPGLPQKEQLRLIWDVANGMDYLERRSCIHRDLAARNCLLDGAKTVKIADFGLSSIAKKEQLKEGLRLPIKWTAPEALHECKFSSKSDVWSYGILVTEVWTGGSEPYPGKTCSDVKKGILDGLRTPIPDPVPSVLRELLLRCWDRNPDPRPSFSAIRKEISSIAA